MQRSTLRALMVRRRWQVSALGTAVAGLLLAGGSVVTQNEPEAGSYSGAGTPLPGGLVVVEGSDLIGPAFPVPRRSGVQRVAVLRVLGDPVAVFQAYIDQMVALPDPDRRAELHVTCDVVYYVPQGDDDVTGKSLAEAAPGRADGIECSATQQPTALSDGYFLTMRRAAHPRGDTAVSGISLSVEPRSEVYASPARPSEASPPERLPAGRVHVDVDLPPLPGEGEVFGDFPPSGLDRGLRVEPGSRLSGPVASYGCTTGGFVAVLEITGDAESVVAAYAEQIDGHGFTIEQDHRSTADGRQVRKVVGSTAGGGTLEVVHLDDGRDWLLITRCND